MKRFLIILFVMFNLSQGVEMKQNDNLTNIVVNNVEIPLIYETSSLLPIGNVSIIFYGGGSVYEDKVALSSFSADMLERGTKSEGEIEFANRLESNAISLKVGSGMETMSFNLEFLKEKQDEAISALSDLLNDPNMTKDAYNQSQLSLKSYLLSKNNDFDYIASKNLNKLIYKGTPLEYGSLGEISDIEAISLGDVKDFIKKVFNLENAVILVGGDVEIESLKPKLVAMLSKFSKGEKVQRKQYSPSDKPSEIKAVAPTKQAFIYFASPFKFNDYKNELHKAQVMSFIMGASGFGSRVMEEIRVKRGLAYSAYFYNSINNVTSSTNGYLQTKLENKDEAIKALKEVIAKFIKNGATKAELEDAKAYILGSSVLRDETLNQRLNKKYMNFNRGLPLEYDKTLLQKIKDLSLEELNSYIKSHVEVNDLSFSVVLDK